MGIWHNWAVYQRAQVIYGAAIVERKGVKDGVNGGKSDRINSQGGSSIRSAISTSISPDPLQSSPTEEDSTELSPQRQILSARFAI